MADQCEPSSEATLKLPIEVSPQVERMCSIVDSNPHLEGAGISYVSSETATVIRNPEFFIETHVVFEDRNRPVADKPGGTYLYRFSEIGLNCGSAGLGYAATAAACGGTALTMGMMAPLCALSVAGSAASSWQCGVALGQLANHQIDPDLADQLEDSDRNRLWNYFNNGVTAVSLLSGAVGAYKGAQAAKNIKTFAEKYKDVSRLNKNDSLKVYKELAHIVGDDVGSNQQVKKWIADGGHRLRFNVTDAAYNQTLRVLKDQVPFLLDITAETTKDARRNAAQSVTQGLTAPPRPGPTRVMHVIQQAPYR